MLSELIDAFVHRHYGYGNLNGKYWLVGMEEGCGDEQDELLRRFEIWDAMGRRETEDVVEYHLRLGIPEFFRDPVKLQHTWGHLIRLVLAAEGKPADKTAVKEYQKDRLGRLGDETCLLELLPLPSPSLGVWPYGEWTGLPYLSSRKVYRKSCITWRAARLREMIEIYRPPAIIFYGVTYRSYYQQIIESPFETQVNGVAWASNRSSLFVLVKHPADWKGGATAAYFEGVGQEIYRRLAQTGTWKPQGPEQPIENYGLYKCDHCGKMVMGYDSVVHTQQHHGGREPGYTRVGKQ